MTSKLIRPLRAVAKGGSGDINLLAARAANEIEQLWATLQSIVDAKEPKDDPAPDDADWRFVALEMKRCAKCAIEQSQERQQLEQALQSWYCEPCAVEVYDLRCTHCGKTKREQS
jgi:hypothetical protein